jgi:hypothetical protein
MPLFSRMDMQFHHYDWTSSPGDHHCHLACAAKKIFNRMDGYEMLYTINKFLADNDFRKVDAGQKAEQLIHSLPNPEKITHQEVWTWLKKNW